MTRRDLQQLRLACFLQFTTAIVALATVFSSVVILSYWGFFGEVLRHYKSDGGAPVFFQISMVLSVIAGVCCLAIGFLSVAVGVNIIRRRHHRFNLVASLVGCALMPFGTVAGILTVAVLNRDTVRAAFGLAPRDGPSPQQ